ncbi:transcription antitermination factor NusB [Candidatus Latescibacterota bacterium]
MTSRRKAREVLLKVLYLSESRRISVDDAVSEMIAVDTEIADMNDDSEVRSLKQFSFGLDNKQKEYVVTLARKIENNSDQLNNYIKPVLRNWDFSRVSRIDRIILWIALAEILYMLDIPHAVSINEAIELAKRYSSEKSSSFINGVLDSALKNIQKEMK